MQAGQTFIQTLLLQAMALYIHGPLRCKDLLGRIPNPHSRPALAAPQHAPGPRSDARSQRTPPGEIMHRLAAPHPAAAPATERPALPAHLRSDRPAASRTQQHTPTQPRSDTQPPTLEAVQHPQPHTIRPPDSRKPARLSSRTGFFFCMMEPDAARIARCIHIPPGRSATDQARREPPARPQPRTQQERARTGSRPQTPPGVATTTPTIRPPTHQQPDRYMLHPSL